jgi:hypothetical protein
MDRNRTHPGRLTSGVYPRVEIAWTLSEGYRSGGDGALARSGSALLAEVVAITVIYEETTNVDANEIVCAGQLALVWQRKRPSQRVSLERGAAFMFDALMTARLSIRGLQLVSHRDGAAKRRRRSRT